MQVRCTLQWSNAVEFCCTLSSAFPLPASVNSAGTLMTKSSNPRNYRASRSKQLSLATNTECMHWSFAWYCTVHGKLYTVHIIGCIWKDSVFLPLWSSMAGVVQWTALNYLRALDSTAFSYIAVMAIFRSFNGTGEGWASFIGCLRAMQFTVQF